MDRNIPAEQRFIRTEAFFPPKFWGKKDEDAEAHWSSFTDYLNQHPELNGDWPTTFGRFKSSLAGAARKWLGDRQFADAEALSTAFIQKFNGIYSREGGRMKWTDATMLPEEPVEAYVERLRTIANVLNKGEEDIQEKLYTSLPEEVAERAEMEGGDLENTIRVAQRMLDIKSRKRNTIKEVSFVQTDVSQVVREELAKQLESVRIAYGQPRGRQSRRRSRSRSFSRSNSRGRDSEGNKGRGYEKGRQRSNSREGRRSATPGKIICDHCSIAGHGWRDCYRLIEEMKEKRFRKTRVPKHEEKEKEEDF